MTTPKMTVWWKNGDHPEVQPTPDAGLDLCQQCGQALNIHGAIDNTLVHPGDSVSVNQLKDGYLVQRPDNPAQAAMENTDGD